MTTAAEREELSQLEERLAEADGYRVSAQRRAREQLTGAGEPVTRLAVARRACELVGDAVLASDGAAALVCAPHTELLATACLSGSVRPSSAAAVVASHVGVGDIGGVAPSAGSPSRPGHVAGSMHTLEFIRSLRRTPPIEELP